MIKLETLVDYQQLANKLGKKMMEEAVKMAHDIAESGDVVLLSPCCASFDLFRNYEDRGKKFKEAVRKL